MTISFNGAMFKIPENYYDTSSSDFYNPFEKISLSDPYNGTQAFAMYNASELTSLMQVNLSVSGLMGPCSYGYWRSLNAFRIVPIPSIGLFYLIVLFFNISSTISIHIVIKHNRLM